MTQTPTRSLAYIAIGAALIAVLSQITIPVGLVPFTLQTLAIGLIASLYPLRETLASIGLYLLLGAVGLPVFAGFSGGFATLVSPTAGFLWGFLAYGAITAFLCKNTKHPASVFLANVLGDAACFVLGAFVFHLVSQASWSDTLAWTIIPFLLPDLMKIVLITLIRPTLKKQLK